MFIWKFFKSLFRHIHYQRIIQTAYKQEQLIAKLSTILGVQFKIDWVGRLYAVINPNIKDGEYNPEQIYEFDVDGNPNNTEWVTKWVMERMNILKNFIQTSNMFDVLEYHITNLGTLNYLVVFQPITLAPVFKYAKYAFVELLILIGLGITAINIF